MNKQTFSCLTSIKNKERNVLFHLKEKGGGAHFKFNPEMTICTAKGEKKIQVHVSPLRNKIFIF